MKTILVIEDDPAIQRGISENLRRERFGVLVEKNGTRGLRRALKDGPDLVILDVMLPGLNGFEVCARLKRHGFSAPVFILTALGDEQSKLRGLGEGADDYLPKPFSVQELVLRIRNTFDRTDRTLGRAKSLEQELRKAGEIQRECLPKRPPRFKNATLWGMMTPASHIGGDYFDYLRLPSGNIAVIVADVCGKGMPAALHVQKMQGVLHASKQSMATAADVLRRLQEYLGPSLGPSSFVTGTVAVLDEDGGTVDIASAGHPPVLLKRGPAVESVSAEGMWIGPEIGRSFEELLRPVTISTQPGDLFVFYTDGVTECMNTAQEEFGMQRWQRVLLHAGDGPRAVVKNSFEELRRFADDGPPSDDITIVALKINSGRNSS